MRGKDTVANMADKIGRITPAHAGKSDMLEPTLIINGDHPRPCGEKRPPRPARLQCHGSPPPMRGKVMVFSALAAAARITPAHAGKSFERCPARCPLRDHPRPCGEKQPLCSAYTRADRITPAHAGKSIECKSIADAGRDHPRPCGEKYVGCSFRPSCQGSPPPMRGKGDTSGVRYVGRGITPAHAGKSIYALRGARFAGDHPRPCGEKVPFLTAPYTSRGSPPPMRGKGGTSDSLAVCHGITPAHAGKSSSDAYCSSCRRDHPRPCGEKCLPRLPAVGTIGSPPPMRGKANYAVLGYF